MQGFTGHGKMNHFANDTLPGLRGIGRRATRRDYFILFTHDGLLNKNSMKIVIEVASYLYEGNWKLWE